MNKHMLARKRAEAWKLKEHMEHRFSPLFMIGEEDASLCRPVLNELLFEPVSKDEVLLSIAEALWLKIAAELIRCQFPVKVVLGYKQLLLGRYTVPEELVNTVEDGFLLTEVDYRFMDQYIGIIAREKHDVVLQLNRQGMLGTSFGTDHSMALTGSGLLTFSINSLLKAIFEMEIQIEQQRLEALSEAEGVLLDTARDADVREFTIVKAAPNRKYRWDLLTVDKGVVTRQKAHEKLVKSIKNYGTFQTIPQKGNMVYYRQEIRQRYY